MHIFALFVACCPPKQAEPFSSLPHPDATTRSSSAAYCQYQSSAVGTQVGGCLAVEVVDMVYYM